MQKSLTVVLTLLFSSLVGSEIKKCEKCLFLERFITEKMYESGGELIEYLSNPEDHDPDYCWAIMGEYHAYDLIYEAIKQDTLVTN